MKIASMSGEDQKMIHALISFLAGLIVFPSIMLLIGAFIGIHKVLGGPDPLFVAGLISGTAIFFALATTMPIPR